ncbi:MAG: aldose 1-epimerase family protein [Cytophagaceae bacterium]
MFVLENDLLKVSATTLGAELLEIIYKPTGVNYLWSGDPAIWGRRAPVLFPIVGKVKDNKYTYKGNPYSLPQHGFARDKEFIVKEQSLDSITFSLTSDTTTLTIYPFQFELQITYKIEKAKLSTIYKVINKDSGDMYYSIGAHPGFTCPLALDELYTDYQLVFNKKEKLSRILLQGGLRSKESESVTLENDQQTLPLNKDLFEVKDAIVVQHLNSDVIRLESKNHSHGLEFSFKNYPWFGIWSKPGPFVCLEPWVGVADSVDASGELTQKEAIEKLASGAAATYQFDITVF